MSRYKGWAMKYFLSAVLGTCILLLSTSAYGDPGNATWFLLDQYLAHDYQEDGRITDFSRGGITTSEGEAYALFFFLVNNDRPRFEKVLSWIGNNLADGDLGKHPISWLWGKNRQRRWGVLDHNTASDADLWITYTLLEAGRLWADPEYLRLGRAIAHRIANTELKPLPRWGVFLVPGIQGFHPAPDLWRLNPSYTPPFILQRLKNEMKGEKWKNLPKLNLSLLRHVSRRGFAPDWTAYSPGKGFFKDPATGYTGSYDAIRVYLWAGMTSSQDPLSHRILFLLRGWARTHSSDVTIKIDLKSGKGAGTPSVGYRAALLPYWARFKCQGLPRRVFRIRHEALQNLASLTYYDWNLLLFGLGYVEGRFTFDREGKLRVLWEKGPRI